VTCGLRIMVSFDISMSHVFIPHICMFHGINIIVYLSLVLISKSHLLVCNKTSF